MVRGILGMVGLWLAITASAAAMPEPEPVAHARGDELVDPQLVSGGGLAWLDRECVRDCELEQDYVDRTTINLARRDGSGRRRLLRRTYLGYEDGSRSYRFSLSHNALGVIREQDYRNRYFPDAASVFRLELGLPRGPLRRLGGCGPIGPAVAAVDGGVLYSERCADDTTRLVLRNIDGTGRVVWAAANPGSDTLRLGRERLVFNISSLEARDGYAVFSTVPWNGDSYDVAQARVHLVRLADGAEVARWHTDAQPSLGDHGDVLLSRVSPGCLTARVHRRGQQDARLVPLPACVTVQPRLAGGRVWAIVNAPTGPRVVSVTPEGSLTTHVDLHGLQASGLLADRRSLGYVTQECDDRPALRVVPLSARVARPVARRCPARPAGQRIRVRRDEFRRAIASVVLRCPRGCSGELGIRRGGRALHEFTTPFQQAAVRGRHPVILGARAVRLLRRQGRLRAMVRVRRVDRAAPQPGPRDFPVTLLR